MTLKDALYNWKFVINIEVLNACNNLQVFEKIELFENK